MGRGRDLDGTDESCHGVTDVQPAGEIETRLGHSASQAAVFDDLEDVLSETRGIARIGDESVHALPHKFPA